MKVVFLLLLQMLSVIKSELCGISTYFNPLSIERKAINYQVFKHWNYRQGLNLIVAELLHEQNKEEEMTFIMENQLTFVIRINTQQNNTAILWQKEALLNLALNKIPNDWPCENIVWIDCDVLLQDGWIQATNEMLKTHVLGQPYWEMIKLPKNNYNPTSYFTEARQRILARGLDTNQIWYSFSYTYNNNNNNDTGYYGFAWAAKLDFLKKINGFYPFCIIGGFDSLLVRTLTNVNSCEARFNENMCAHYENHWGNEFKRVFFSAVSNKQRLFTMPKVKILASHLYHGERKHRQYLSRHFVLSNYSFNPFHHVYLHPTLGYLKWNTSFDLLDLQRSIDSFFLNRKENE